MKIALTKGYLLEKSLDLFAQIGIEIEKSELQSRKLFLYDKTKKYQFVIIRPADVPIYVEYGAVDIGIAGKDVLLEENLSVAELLDLKFGKCSLVTAVNQASKIKKILPQMKIATKFVNIVKNHYQNKGLNLEIIKLYGSVELASCVGLADAVSDLTATGATLKENNLVIIENIVDSTARLIANKVKLKTNFQEIIKLAKSLEKII